MCNVWIYHWTDYYHSPLSTRTGIWPLGNRWERETTDRRNRWTIPAALWPFRFNINRKKWQREEGKKSVGKDNGRETQRQRTKGVVLKYFAGYFLDWTVCSRDTRQILLKTMTSSQQETVIMQMKVHDHTIVDQHILHILYIHIFLWNSGTGLWACICNSKSVSVHFHYAWEAVRRRSPCVHCHMIQLRAQRGEGERVLGEMRIWRRK